MRIRRSDLPITVTYVHYLIKTLPIIIIVYKNVILLSNLDTRPKSNSKLLL